MAGREERGRWGRMEIERGGQGEVGG